MRQTRREQSIHNLYVLNRTKIVGQRIGWQSLAAVEINNHTQRCEMLFDNFSVRCIAAPQYYN